MTRLFCIQLMNHLCHNNFYNFFVILFFGLLIIFYVCDIIETNRNVCIIKIFNNYLTNISKKNHLKLVSSTGLIPSSNIRQLFYKPLFTGACLPFFTIFIFILSFCLNEFCVRCIRVSSLLTR